MLCRCRVVARSHEVTVIAGCRMVAIPFCIQRWAGALLDSVGELLQRDARMHVLECAPCRAVSCGVVSRIWFCALITY